MGKGDWVTHNYPPLTTVKRVYYPANSTPSSISTFRFSILLPHRLHLNRPRLCSRSIPTLNSVI